MDPHRKQPYGPELVALPPELLQAILQNVPNKFVLRLTCKAFSNALRSCCGSLLLKYEGLAARGPRLEVSSALSAFRNAGRVVLCLHEGRGRAQPCASNVAQDAHEKDISTQGQLLSESLDALRGRKLWSVSLLSLSHPLPSLSALTQHSDTLLELELSDTSYSFAFEQGAFNALVKLSDACRCSDALVGLALALPRLRRLYLASAAFRADSVATLAKLTQLESLSIMGSLDCPGGAPQAAATYSVLLRGLSALRQLKLPLAVAPRGVTLLDDVDDDDDDDEMHWGGQGRQLHWPSFTSRMITSSSTSSGGDINGSGSGWGSGSGSGSGWASNAQQWVFGSNWIGAPPSLPFMPPQLSPEPGKHATTLLEAVFGPQPESLAHLRCAASSMVSGSSTAAGEPLSVGKPPLGRGGALHACGSVRQQKRHPQAADLADAILLPPLLQHLTIPLCALNRPVFEALCAAYGRAEGTDADVGDQADQQRSCGATPRTLRTSSSSSASSANSCCGAPVVAQGCSSTDRQGTARDSSRPWSHNRTTAGCAEVWAATHDRPGVDPEPDPLRGSGLQPLGVNIDVKVAVNINRGRVCNPGSSSSDRGGGPRLSLHSLHIPTLAGYPRYEGGFLASEEDFRKLARLESLEVLHVTADFMNLNPGGPRPGRDTMRTCFQHLRALKALREVRVSEAQRPVCWAVRKGAYQHPGGIPFRGASSRVPSDATLKQLQQQWPRLQSLQFFSETVVRNGGLLVVPCGPDSLDRLPPQCSCCSGPVLKCESPGATAGGRARTVAGGGGVTFPVVSSSEDIALLGSECHY